MTDQERLRRSLARWSVAGITIFLLLLATFPLYRTFEGERRTEEAAVYRGEQIWTGQKLYADNCAMCHGDQGQGVDAPALNSKEFLRASNEEQIVGIVSVGIPGTNMQSWSTEYGGPLTPEEIHAVAAFLASLEPGAPSRPDWRNFTPSPTPPPSPIAGAPSAGFGENVGTADPNA